MKFYIVQDTNGTVVGCETSLTAAKKLGRQYADSGFTVARAEYEVTSQTIRALLAGDGGATEYEPDFYVHVK
jgi:hypothetical protein